MPKTPEKIALAKLRTLAGLTQEEVGSRIGWTWPSQPTVSEFERSKAPSLPTLRKYIEACGGRLELRVRLGGEEFILEDPAETGRERQKIEASLPMRERSAFKRNANRVDRARLRKK